MGGVSPGYIEGLNYRWTAAEQITIDSGAAWCPYTSNPHVVVLASPLVLSVPVGTALSRTNLWLHDDNGVPTVVSDDFSVLTDNYFGSAFRHPTNKGWRYIGSLMRNSLGGLFAQGAENGVHTYYAHMAQAPFEALNTTAQTAARTVNLNSVIPASAISVIAQLTASAAVLRVAASSATAAGNTVSSGWYVALVLSGASSVIDVPLGRDQAMQYASDAATGTLTMRCIGYRYRR
jgi:hypothetical protein